MFAVTCLADDQQIVPIVGEPGVVKVLAFPVQPFRPLLRPEVFDVTKLRGCDDSFAISAFAAEEFLERRPRRNPDLLVERDTKLVEVLLRRRRKERVNLLSGSFGALGTEGLRNGERSAVDKDHTNSGDRLVRVQLEAASTARSQPQDTETLAPVQPHYRTFEAKHRRSHIPS